MIGTNLNSKNSKCCYSYGASDYWVAWGHDPPAGTFKDDKLLGLLRAQSQIIRPGPVRGVIKFIRCCRKIVRATSKYELSAYFISTLNTRTGCKSDVSTMYEGGPITYPWITLALITTSLDNAPW